MTTTQREIRFQTVIFLIDRPQSAKNKQGYVDPHGYLLTTPDRLRHGDRIVQPIEYTRYYDESRDVLIDVLHNRMRAGNEECVIDLAIALKKLEAKRNVEVETIAYSDEWDFDDDVPREYVIVEMDA